MFTHFYTLSIDNAFTMFFAITFIIVFLDNIMENIRLKRIIYWGMMLLSNIAIIYLTLISRRCTQVNNISLIPFKSYIDVARGENIEILRANFMNIMLFYPSGLSSTLLLKKKSNLVLAFIFVLLFSCGIEAIQYAFLLGYVEIDDVIHNFLGFILGFVAVKGLNLYFKNF